MVSGRRLPRAGLVSPAFSWLEGLRDHHGLLIPGRNRICISDMQIPTVKAKERARARASLMFLRCDFVLFLDPDLYVPDLFIGHILDLA